MRDATDTICALGTPPGRSGIAVARLSGAQTLPILRRVCAPVGAGKNADWEPRRASLRRLVDPRAAGAAPAVSVTSVIDEALVTFFRAPHSYTGEDLAEFALHGNPVLVSALLDILCYCGARPAEPGEFTLRAFLHGRIDLSGAEAVRDVIEARTLRQAQIAARQRDGSLSRELNPVKEKLIEVIVQLESALEFAEDDLPLASRAALTDNLRELERQIARWIASWTKGRIVREGFTLAIVGPPNAGKSSVFNALLGRERSIVTDIPGTTRDLVAEDAALDGIPVRLEDTAGLRAGGDAIERMGMERSRQAAADADVVLLVADASQALAEATLDLRRQLVAARGIVVLNKSDLPARVTAAEKAALTDGWPGLDVSAKTGQGIEELRSLLLRQLWGAEGLDAEGTLITNLRHCQALRRAGEHLERGRAALERGLSEEFILFDLRQALDALGEITGETGTEDLLGEIFSRFCIGK